MNKITKGQTRMYYEGMKRKEKYRVMATVMLLIPLVGMLFWLGGCQTPSEDVYDYPTTTSKLQQDWDDIYDGVIQVHPPRHYGYTPERAEVDYEVEYLNYLLNPTGISAFRIDPTNPQHQRRFRRHLEQPLAFYDIPEEDI